ncbi:unnamed protein product [Amoebophrya sp. A25]|nr:unnamed protein product [Amoebophrya sp. A25]|eukprot:GSA25T00022178001.1
MRTSHALVMNTVPEEEELHGSTTEHTENTPLGDAPEPPTPVSSGYDEDVDERELASRRRTKISETMTTYTGGPSSYGVYGGRESSSSEPSSKEKRSRSCKCIGVLCVLSALLILLCVGVYNQVLARPDFPLKFLMSSSSSSSKPSSTPIVVREIKSSIDRQVMDLPPIRLPSNDEDMMGGNVAPRGDHHPRDPSVQRRPTIKAGADAFHGQNHGTTGSGDTRQRHLPNYSKNYNMVEGDDDEDSLLSLHDSDSSLYSSSGGASTAGDLELSHLSAFGSTASSDSLTLSTESSIGGSSAALDARSEDPTSPLVPHRELLNSDSAVELMRLALDSTPNDEPSSTTPVKQRPSLGTYPKSPRYSGGRKSSKLDASRGGEEQQTSKNETQQELKVQKDVESSKSHTNLPPVTTIPQGRDIEGEILDASLRKSATLDEMTPLKAQLSSYPKSASRSLKSVRFGINEDEPDHSEGRDTRHDYPSTQWPTSSSSNTYSSSSSEDEDQGYSGDDEREDEGESSSTSSHSSSNGKDTDKDQEHNIAIASTSSTPFSSEPTTSRKMLKRAMMSSKARRQLMRQRKKIPQTNIKMLMGGNHGRHGLDEKDFEEEAGGSFQPVLVPQISGGSSTSSSSSRTGSGSGASSSGSTTPGSSVLQVLSSGLHYSVLKFPTQPQEKSLGDGLRFTLSRLPLTLPADFDPEGPASLQLAVLSYTPTDAAVALAPRTTVPPRTTELTNLLVELPEDPTAGVRSLDKRTPLFFLCYRVFQVLRTSDNYTEDEYNAVETRLLDVLAENMPPLLVENVETIRAALVDEIALKEIPEERIFYNSAIEDVVDNYKKDIIDAEDGGDFSGGARTESSTMDEEEPATVYAVGDGLSDVADEDVESILATSLQDFGQDEDIDHTSDHEANENPRQHVRLGDEDEYDEYHPSGGDDFDLNKADNKNNRMNYNYAHRSAYGSRTHQDRDLETDDVPRYALRDLAPHEQLSPDVELDEKSYIPESALRLHPGEDAENEQDSGPLSISGAHHAHATVPLANMQVTRFLSNVVRQTVQDIKEAIVAERAWKKFDLSHGPTRSARLKQFFAVWTILGHGTYELRLHFDDGQYLDVSFEKSSRGSTLQILHHPAVEDDRKHAGSVLLGFSFPHFLKLNRELAGFSLTPNREGSQIYKILEQNGLLPELQYNLDEGSPSSAVHTGAANKNIRKNAAGGATREDQLAALYSAPQSNIATYHEDDDISELGAFGPHRTPFNNFPSTTSSLYHDEDLDSQLALTPQKSTASGSSPSGSSTNQGGPQGQGASSSSILAASESYLVRSVDVLSRRTTDEKLRNFADFEVLVMADNGSNGSVDAELGTKILERYVDAEVPAEERLHKLPALKFPEVLPPDGACFGVVLAFIVTAIRNFGIGAQLKQHLSPQLGRETNATTTIPLDSIAENMGEDDEEQEVVDTKQHLHLHSLDEKKSSASKSSSSKNADKKKNKDTTANEQHNDKNTQKILSQQMMLRESAQLVRSGDASSSLNFLSTLTTPASVNRFQSPNMLHRTLQAVFESAIYFDRARHKSIGSHYGRIINGLANIFGFEVGAPRIYPLQDADLASDVFEEMPDGLFVFTIGKDGDQHALAIAKAKGDVLLLEPNQGLMYFQVQAAEKLRPYLEVYENLASRDGIQRHKGKLYPVIGVRDVDETLMKRAEQANEKP